MAFTRSSSVGEASPFSLCAYRIAAVRRPIVDGRTPFAASDAAKAATDSGKAGRAFVHSRSAHTWKIAKSLE